MTLTWDLILHIMIASFLAGDAFSKRFYWFSLMFVAFAVIAPLSVMLEAL